MKKREPKIIRIQHKGKWGRWFKCGEPSNGVVIPVVFEPGYEYQVMRREIGPVEYREIPATRKVKS